MAQRAVAGEGPPLSRQQRRALALRERRQRNRQQKRVALAVGAVLAGAGPAAAATFLVTNAGDAGAGSFRQAIVDATAAATGDTIAFDTAGVFSVPQTITLLTALPPVTNAGGALTIQGPGPAQLTIRRDPGAANFRILDSLAPTLVITGVTLTGGRTAADGGAILLSGTLTLNNSVLSGNQALGGTSGGAIFAESGASVIIRNSVISGNFAGTGGGVYGFQDNTMTVQDSTISGNTATGPGGGVYAFGGGSLVIERSVISGNTSGSQGGGVYTFDSVPVLDVRHSTISGNTATVDGGGLYFYGTSSIEIENSTIANNNAGRNGGGVFWVGPAGSLTVRNSTVTSNTASGAAPSGGGGIFELGDAVPLVANSVVSGNTNANGPDILSLDLYGGPGEVDANFSAIGSNTGFTLSASSANNLAFGTDPLLGPLQDNGGPTQTRLPMLGSPLINAGSNGLVPASPYDQRGPCFRRIHDTTVDIGSVEVGVVPGDEIFCNGFDPLP